MRLSSREAPKRKAPAQTPSNSGAVSDQVVELNAELLETLGHLNALIDNRSAWADAIEGCREAVTLLRSLQGRLHAVLEGTQKVESDLASSREETSQLNKMHGELSVVERNLRADNERLRKTHADILVTAQEQSEEHEKKRAVLAKQVASLANVRALAEEMIREIAS